MGFNGRVGRALMDAELADAGVIPPFNITALATVGTHCCLPSASFGQHSQHSLSMNGAPGDAWATSVQLQVSCLFIIHVVLIATGVCPSRCTV